MRCARRADAILVGGGHLARDHPRLDVRLPGLEDRSPDRWVLTRGQAPEGWQALHAPEDISRMAGVQYLFVEGGAQTAAAFLAAGLVDRLLIYRAPILMGGRPALGDYRPYRAGRRPMAPGCLCERRQLGSDTLEVYEAANRTDQPRIGS